MSFMTPLAFLGLLATIPVIALYFLKLKRRQVPISSTWLWMRSINDLRVNAPFQRLRKSLLLLLQLLLIALATLALTRPMGKAQHAEGKLWILLIDRSASMAMTDVEPSRLGLAKEMARARIQNLADEDRVMIIAFARHPTVIVPATRDFVLAERALDTIEPAETATRITEAFQVAVSNAKRSPDAEIVIFSDGNVEAINVPVEKDPRFIPVGGKPHNAAVTALQVGAPRTPDDPWTVFVTLDLFSDRETEASLELYLNGALKSVRRVELKPGKQTPVVFEVTQPVPHIVEARLILEDDLALDNRAWHVVEQRKPKVLYISQGNFFLKQSLQQMSDAIDAFEVKPGGLGEIAIEDYDVIVCDGRLPAEVPEGRYLFLNCLPAWEGFAAGGELTEPPIVDWYRRHPVTRSITFAGINVLKATELTLPEFAMPLVETTEYPLIAGWERGDTRAVIVAFDILDSDWPLRLSFPLFISNAIEWLAGRSAGDWRAEPRTGDALHFRIGAQENQITVTPPDGKPRVLEGLPGSTRSFGETERAGLYRVEHAGGREPFAVNLMDPTESSGRVKMKIEVDQKEIGGEPAIAPPPTEWWRWFAWAVLILLLIEWWVYHRRIELF